MKYVLDKKSQEFLDSVLSKFEHNGKGTITLHIANGSSESGYSTCGPIQCGGKITNREISFSGHIYFDFKCGKDYEV